MKQFIRIAIMTAFGIEVIAFSSLYLRD